jgi:hypothetical protein
MKKNILRVTTIIAGTAVLTFSLLAQPSKAPAVKSPNTPEVITDISDAWVQLFDDKSFKDRVLTVKGENDIKDLKNVKSDNGEKGFNDKASSLKFQIPEGWELVLFDDHDYKDSGLELKGTGKVGDMSDLGSFSDKASSMRWERIPQ